MDNVEMQGFEARCLERRKADAEICCERLDKLMVRVVHVEELIDQRLAMADENLRRQAVEYERRLTEVNSAHGRALDIQGRTLPRERFEVFEREYVDFRRAMESNTAAAAATARTWGVAAGVVATLLSLALHLWK